ncbi:hypothetical protein PMAYCL1PPCAC_31679, partial [Pristionchus mayeri]
GKISTRSLLHPNATDIIPIENHYCIRVAHTAKFVWYCHIKASYSWYKLHSLITVQINEFVVVCAGLCSEGEPSLFNSAHSEIEDHIIPSVGKLCCLYGSKTDFWQRTSICASHNKVNHFKSVHEIATHSLIGGSSPNLGAITGILVPRYVASHI